MIYEKSIIWANTELIFTNLKAVYHPETSTLIIADLHLGKAAHFRKHGIGIPESVAIQDLKNLKLLLAYFPAKRLIIAGDFFHAKANSELKLFLDWQTEIREVEMILVKGNHDRLDKTVYERLNFNILKKWQLTQGIEIVHQAEQDSFNTQISGHIHPGIIMQGKGRQRMRIPAFIYNQNQIILPAFSLFTGLYTQFDTKEFNFIGIAKDGLIEI